MHSGQRAPRWVIHHTAFMCLTQSDQGCAVGFIAPLTTSVTCAHRRGPGRNAAYGRIAAGIEGGGQRRGEGGGGEEDTSSSSGTLKLSTWSIFMPRSASRSSSFSACWSTDTCWIRAAPPRLSQLLQGEVRRLTGNQMATGSAPGSTPELSFTLYRTVAVAVAAEWVAGGSAVSKIGVCSAHYTADRLPTAGQEEARGMRTC